MTKNRKKHLKQGLTLVEVIISMTIFAILSMMVLLAFTASSRMLIDNTENNKAIDKQSGIVETKDFNKGVETTEDFDFELTISADGSLITVEKEFQLYEADDTDAYTFRFYKPK